MTNMFTSNCVTNIIPSVVLVTQKKYEMAWGLIHVCVCVCVKSLKVIGDCNHHYRAREYQYQKTISQLNTLSLPLGASLILETQTIIISSRKTCNINLLFKQLLTFPALLNPQWHLQTIFNILNKLSPGAHQQFSPDLTT